MRQRRRRHPTASAAFPRTRDVDGRWLCAWCKGLIPPGRSRYCCEGCADEVAVRTMPGVARRLVKKRDRGVCVECRLDTAALERGLRRLRAAVWASGAELLALALEEIRRQLGVAGFGRRGRPFRWGQHLWEADHVVAVEEGGGDLGLDNLVTRCLPCHKLRTAKQARARAERRRRSRDAGADAEVQMRGLPELP